MGRVILETKPFLSSGLELNHTYYHQYRAKRSRAVVFRLAFDLIRTVMGAISHQLSVVGTPT
jgi:hypothetical protein